MRALALAAVLALLASGAAAQGCLLFCGDELTLEGEEAATRIEGWLGQPLPAGAVVEHLREDGFMDPHVQARLEVDAAALVPLLRAMDLSPSKLAPYVPFAGALATPPWWDVNARKDAKLGYGVLPLGRYATVYVAPAGPGRRTVWIEAFGT